MVATAHNTNKKPFGSRSHTGIDQNDPHPSLFHYSKTSNSNKKASLLAYEILLLGKYNHRRPETDWLK